MGRTCHGYYFKIRGAWFWLCASTNKITELAEHLVAGDECPTCKKAIAGKLVKVDTRVIIIREVRREGSEEWHQLSRAEIF